MSKTFRGFVAFTVVVCAMAMVYVSHEAGTAGDGALTPVNNVALVVSDPPALTFGVMADVQGGDYQPIHKKGERRDYGASAWRLGEAAYWLNQVEGIDFVIECGDFVENDPMAWNALLPIWSSITAPAHHVVGNHDIYARGTDYAVDRMGLDAPFYAVDVNGWRLIVLNTNPLVRYVDEGDYSLGHSLHMGEQLDWLREQLTTCDRAFVFGHHPEVFPAIAPVMAEYGNAPVYFCGHDHAGGYEQLGGVHKINLKAMCNGDSNAFAVVRVYEDRIEIDGFGREPDRVIEGY